MSSDESKKSEFFLRISAKSRKIQRFLRVSVGGLPVYFALFTIGFVFFKQTKTRLWRAEEVIFEFLRTNCYFWKPFAGSPQRPDCRRIGLALVHQTGFDGPVRAEPFHAFLRKMDDDDACAATAAALKKAFTLID